MNVSKHADDPWGAGDRIAALDYWNAANDLLFRSGYTAAIRHDLDAWADYVRSQPTAPIVNPTLDPACSDLHGRNSMWLDIRRHDGRRAAVVANRVMDCGDFAEDFANGYVHYARPTPEDRMKVRAEVPRGLLSGRVGHAGGLFVEDHAKKQRFPWLTSPLMRAYSILTWDVDRQCGAIFGSLKAAGFATDAYRFKDCWLAVDGWFPPAKKIAQVWIMHIDRAEIVEQLRLDAAWIMADRNKKLVDLAAIIGERKKQAAILGPATQVVGRDVG